MGEGKLYPICGEIRQTCGLLAKTILFFIIIQLLALIIYITVTTFQI